MSNHEQDDNVLNNYLEGHSEISKHYRDANKAEPSLSLDEKILSAAKKAVAESEPDTTRFKLHKSPWAKSVSVAAVITLSVSLIITMQQQAGQPLISEPKNMNDSLISPTTSVNKPETASADFDMLINEEAETEVFSDKVISDYAPSSLKAVETYREEKQASEAKLEILEHSTKKLVGQEKLKKKMKSPIIVEEPLYAELAKANMNDSAAMEDVMLKKQQKQLLSEIKSFLEKGQLIKAKEKLKQFRENHVAYSEEAIKEVVGEELLNLLNSE